MNTKKHLAAFAALLSPALLFATSINVTFDAALTNATGWAYDPAVKIAADNHVYFNSGNTSITSPAFPFVITNISLDLSCSSTTPARKLVISLPDSHEIEIPYVHEVDKHEQTTFDIDEGNHFRSFAISTLAGKSGNWHIYSAVISGVPLIEPPTNLQTNDIRGTRCKISWTNPENAVSNKIEVSELVEIETNDGSILEYDFGDFANNSGSAKDITEEFTNAIPAFAGSSVVKLPASTDGIIQISDGNGKGFLVHSGFQDCSKLSVTISLKVPTDRQSKDFGIGYEDAAGHTNEFPLITLVTNNFVTHSISLATLPANTPLIFNTHGSGTKRVVYVDYLAFINDSPSTTISTNLVKTVFATDPTTYSVKGLRPWTEYIAKITAFDADGNESETSEPISFMTNGAEMPLVIKLQ